MIRKLRGKFHLWAVGCAGGPIRRRSEISAIFRLYLRILNRSRAKHTLLLLNILSREISLFEPLAQRDSADSISSEAYLLTSYSGIFLRRVNHRIWAGGPRGGTEISFGQRDLLEYSDISLLVWPCLDI